MHIGTIARTGLLAGFLLATSAGALAQSDPAEVAQREALNAEQARFAAKQIADFEAEKQAVAQAQAAKEQAYRDALAAHEAEVAAIRQKATDDRARWEAAVAACLAGDRTQCAQPAVPAGK